MKKFILSIFLLVDAFTVIAQTDTSFWFAAPDISSVYSYDRPIVLKISSYLKPCTVTISQPANGGMPDQIFSIPANTLQSVDLTAWLDDIECGPGNVVQNKGIKITSDNKIGVYYEVNGTGPNPEMFALKGRNAVGNQFYISSQYFLDNTSNYDPLPYSSFNIVSTENNCVVTITPTANIIGHAAGIPFQITLNRGQTYAAIATSQAASQHLQGSSVFATKPVAVTLSDDLLFGNHYGGGVCSDLAGDQTVPVEIIGNEYIAFKTDLYAPYDKVYITASQDLTSIFQDGTLAGVLSKGQSIELTLNNSASYIKASAPVYAYQLSGVGCEVGSAILPKINCTGSSSVSVARSTNEPFKITLLVKNGAQTNFFINGAAGIITGAQFTAVPGTAGLYYFARIDLPLSNYPNGSVITISNSADVFQLGVLQGGVLSGASFGYFSDFNSIEANASAGDTKPCTGNNVSLFAETISSATYAWKGPNNFTSNLQNPVLNSVVLANTGNYILKVAVPGCGVYNDTVNIKVNSKSAVTINQTICKGQSFAGYTATGIYIDTLTATNGCDSIRTINLSVKPGAFSVTNQTICQGQVFAGYSKTGTYVDTLKSASGCDSVRTINLTVKPSSSIRINQFICQGNSYQGHTTSGIYIDTLKAVNGCDSIRTLSLTVIPSASSHINKVICQGQFFEGYNVTGLYVDTLVSAQGCDSIRIINLTVNKNITSLIVQVICQGETYAGYGSSGFFVDTLLSSGGCDSIRTLRLTVRPGSTSTINQIICQGENYAGYTTSGKYIDTLKSANGCDSIRTINLSVKHVPVTTINQAICLGENYFGHTASGTYVDTFTGSNGCDSIRTVNLVVDNPPKPHLGPDTAICTLDTIRLIPGMFAQYLWQDGSTQSSFLIKSAGVYSVSVTNGCGMASDAIIITEKACEIFFPNAFTPNNDGKNDVFRILNGDQITDFDLIIFDRWGEKVFESHDYKKGWDGKKKNKPADVGGYVWYCKYKESGIFKTMQGSVLLIR